MRPAPRPTSHAAPADACRGDRCDLLDAPAWQDRAACKGMGIAWFFPAGTTGPALDQIARAKAVCARCDVCSQCLAYALETGQDAGVWGGLSEDERRALRRRRRRQSRQPHRP